MSERDDAIHAIKRQLDVAEGALRSNQMRLRVLRNMPLRFSEQRAEIRTTLRACAFNRAEINRWGRCLEWIPPHAAR